MDLRWSDMSKLPSFNPAHEAPIVWFTFITRRFVYWRIAYLQSASTLPSQELVASGGCILDHCGDDHRLYSHRIAGVVVLGQDWWAPPFAIFMALPRFVTANSIAS